MSVLDTINAWVTRAPSGQVRSDPFDPDPLPDMQSQIAALRRRHFWPWRQVSPAEALTVPAIYRAVTLISNTVGALSMEAFRDGSRLAAADTPRIVQRPNPFATPREFHRETTYDMATRGEAWWWIAKRDADGIPISLYPMPAYQVTVTQNDRDLLRPIIEWNGVRMRNDDVRQVVLSREPGQLRGQGPLQACGIAVSVAVEAQDWAATFFAAGGTPSMVIKSALGELSELEAKKLKGQWLESGPNEPRVIDQRIEKVEDFSIDPAKAQLTDARRFSNGEAAVMYGVPASLLDHFESGASLTYQNVGQEYDKFVRACLWPNYLEPIEQVMSDMLTRSTVSRFSLSGLLRADVKTRFDTYNIGIPLGVYTVEEAREKEGLEPGDIETAPVPAALPQSIPARVPIQGRAAAEAIRCDGYFTIRNGGTRRCNKWLAPGFVGYCPRCRKDHKPTPKDDRSMDLPVMAQLARS